MDVMSLNANDQCTRNDVYAAMCPCRDMLDLLANKWSALVIGVLEPGRRSDFVALNGDFEVVDVYRVREF